MRGSRFTHQNVIGAAKVLGLQLLLKLCLEVCQLPSGFLNIFDLRLKETQHDAPGLINSAVQINGAKNRLKGIHQQGFRFRERLGEWVARPMARASGSLVADSNR